MTRASFSVESRELTLAQIVDAMGAPPDDGYDLGSLSPIRGVPREWSRWSRELVWPSGIHGGTEGLSAAIEALGRPLAERAGRLRARGCDVVLVVVQELTLESKTHGLHLTHAAIQVLDIAGAVLSVDQYVDDETEPETPDSNR